MEISSGELSRVKKEQPFTYKDPTPLERILIDGTVVVEGVRLNIEALEDYLRNRVAPWGKLLTPLSILSSSGENRGTKEGVNWRRLQKKRLVDTLIVFDFAQLVELKSQGKTPYLELPALDESGKARFFFKVGLTDQDGNEINASELHLNPKFRSRFALGRDLESLDSKHRVLHVKP